MKDRCPGKQAYLYVMENTPKLYEICIFESMAAAAECLESDMQLEEAIRKVSDMIEENKYYGIEILSLDPDEPEPIVFVHTRD